MSEDTIKQRCNELKRRIEFLKEECDTLFGKLSVYVYKNELDNCYLCIGSLKNNFTNSYNMVGEILETVTSHIDQLEYRVEQLEYHNEKLKSIVKQLVFDKERQINSVTFLGTYRDWVGIFINEVADRLEKGDWKLVKKSLARLSNKLTLTEQQIECLKELEELLEGVGMTLNDMELLRQMKDQSNIKFHSNNQSLDQVKSLLHIPVPDEMNQYKSSLQKALDAIDKWNPMRTKFATQDVIYFSDQK